MSFNLKLLSCPKCGGTLKETNDGNYICSHCNNKWKKELSDSFVKIFDGFETAMHEEKAAELARLKSALYTETHKEFVNNAEVERICKEILNHYNDDDFYARFYLATCDTSKTALAEFCSEHNIVDRKDDIREFLDYLITGLREEWFMSVSNIIEQAFKHTDTDLYSEYRTRFEEMEKKLEDGIFEPTLPRDVFVMYSGKDMDKVLKMVSMLENEYDLTCFVAAKNLRHGAGSTDRYKDAIHAAIENCSVYLLISSQNSRSRQCEVYEEILYIMDNCPDKPRVEYLADDYQGYGMEKKFREFFAGLEYCTSYEDTARRISDYCDELQTKPKEKRASTVKSGAKAVKKAGYGNTQDEVAILISKAKRQHLLGNKKVARTEYEAIIEKYPDDIRAYIEIVALVSDNYTNTNCEEADSHIKVINEFFGEEAALAADKKYASYIEAIEEAKKQAKIEEERRRKEAEERRKREEADRRKREEDRRKREEEDRIRREREEAEARKRREREEAEARIRYEREAAEARKRRELEERMRKKQEIEETKRRASAAKKAKVKDAFENIFDFAQGFGLSAIAVLVCGLLLFFGMSWDYDHGNGWFALCLIVSTGFALVHALDIGTSTEVWSPLSIIAEIIIGLEIMFLCQFEIEAIIIYVGAFMLTMNLYPMYLDNDFTFGEKILKTACMYGATVVFQLGTESWMLPSFEESTWNALWITPILAFVVTILSTIGSKDEDGSNTVAIIVTALFFNAAVIFNSIGICLDATEFDLGMILFILAIGILSLFASLIAYSIIQKDTELITDVLDFAADDCCELDLDCCDCCDDC